MYLSKKDVSLGYKNNNYYLVYELSSSLQVSFNKAIGTQMALVHNGYLNEKQRFLLETTVCYQQTENIFILEVLFVI